MNQGVVRTIKELMAAYPYLNAPYHEKLLEDLKLMIATISSESYIEGFKKAEDIAINSLQDLSELV